jgi:hypothetical protein
MKLENNDKFVISYFAEKHKKTIFRKAKWNDKCKEWISKQGERLMTYFDIDANGYRTAKGKYTIIATGGSDDTIN